MEMNCTTFDSLSLPLNAGDTGTFTNEEYTSCWNELVRMRNALEEISKTLYVHKAASDEDATIAILSRYIENKETARKALAPK